MKTLNIFLLLISLFAKIATAQVSINTDGTQPDPSAILEVKSSNKGVLLPRMSLNARNSINNPAEGLIIFCTDCSIDGTGSLCVFTDGNWFIMNLCKISSPTCGTNSATNCAIQWNWNTVIGAEGYKWGTVNSFTSAVDLGTNLTDTENGLNCGTSYTRYVWAYNGCGYSSPLILSYSTESCFNCGQTITVTHTTGNVAPVNKTVTYGTVGNVPGEPSKCWITSNLGSNHQASNYNDNTEASAGWYWQFNRIQGYKHDGTTRTPNSTWISYYFEYLNWTSGNDPCSHELGNGWRVPTRLEWDNAHVAGGWGGSLTVWNSVLKIHAAGRLNLADAALANRGAYGTYWSSTQTTEELAWRLNFNTGSCMVGNVEKPYGFTIRCIYD
jgi:hypothetical protein